MFTKQQTEKESDSAIEDQNNNDVTEGPQKYPGVEDDSEGGDDQSAEENHSDGGVQDGGSIWANAHDIFNPKKKKQVVAMTKSAPKKIAKKEQQEVKPSQPVTTKPKQDEIKVTPAKLTSSPTS